MAYTNFEFEGTIVRVEEVVVQGEKTVSPKKTSITVDTVKKSLQPILKFGSTMLDEISELAPDEMELSFGIDLSLESGNLCWGIAKGTSSTHFNLTLTWCKKGS